MTTVCFDALNSSVWLDLQDKIFETPTVLLSGHVSGEEEVPVGVQAPFDPCLWLLRIS